MVTDTHTPIRTDVAARVPGPPELLPGCPDAVIDLQTDGGVERVGGQWRYADARVVEIDFVDVGHPDDPLGPGLAPNRTFDIEPHAEARDYDDSGWRTLSPAETQLRLSQGRVCFNWYRIAVTIPDALGGFDPTGASVVFEVAIDDYAEVWVDGGLPHALGDSGGPVVAGFNAPNRVLLTDDARPGQSFQIAVFGINGPISASPRNYIWMRTATLDFYAPHRARPASPATLDVDRIADGLDLLLAPDATLERVAGGFEFTEGPVWSPDGSLLFSSPNTNAIYRWHPSGGVTVFRCKSGYTGADIGRFTQPGSNGLTFDPDGRLTICQHGNRRVIRVEPHGNTTVLADRYEGRRLNSPNDLVYRSDGTLFVTDPPFGLPDMFDDPGKELEFSGVFAVRDGRLTLVTDELEGPNGLAFSPDEHYLYVANWDPERKVVMRYELDADTSKVIRSSVLCDMTAADGDDAIDGDQGRPGGQRLRLRAGRHLDHLARRGAPRDLAAARGAAQPRMGRRRRPRAVRDGADERLPHPIDDTRHPPPLARPEGADTVSDKLQPGMMLPDFELPDENGVMHRLSELQGDEPMVVLLGRGEHCPRERQHQRELIKLYEWCVVGFTNMVTILPNDQHETYKLKISTPAQWTHLCDENLEVQRGLGIHEYTDPHHDNATVPHTLVLAPGLVIDKVYVGYWFWGRPSAYRLWDDLEDLFRRIKPDFDPTTADARAAWQESQQQAVGSMA
ncbi:MAG TPA: SMP-30/gluconolactonase/LRE family protein [Solirubrobacteraceae bacterium]|nr:SMP-30/gluconolactonase/LRE family protein [Solirubrobacteraceae bacterium]